MSKSVRYLEYLLMAVVMLQFGTVYSVFDNVKPFFTYAPIVILFYLNISNGALQKFEGIKLLLYLLGAIPLYYMASGGGKMIFLQSFVFFLPLMWIYLNYKEKTYGREGVGDFLLKFSNIIYVIEIISLFFWLFGSILKIIPPTGVYPYEWAGEWKPFVPTYYNIYFETQDVISMGMTFTRNTSIFNEAPYSQTIFISAFLIDFYFKKDISKYRRYVMIASILTTGSTTAYMVLLLFYTMNRLSKINKITFPKLISIILVLVIAYFASTYLLQDKNETGAGSVETRTETIWVDINMGLSHPLFGVGVGNNFTGTDKFHTDQSNGLFYAFALYGFYGISLYVGSLVLIPFSYWRRQKDDKIFLVMFPFFVIFIFTLIQHSYLIMLFMAWGLTYMGRNNTFIYGQNIINNNSDIQHGEVSPSLS